MGNSTVVDNARLKLARRPLGRTGLSLSLVGFGAFKIGRNIGIKYENSYALPSDDASNRLLHAVIDELGINYIDTAPAYGLILYAVMYLGVVPLRFGNPWRWQGTLSVLDLLAHIGVALAIVAVATRRPPQ